MVYDNMIKVFVIIDTEEKADYSTQNLIILGPLFLHPACLNLRF